MFILGLIVGVCVGVFIPASVKSVVTDALGKLWVAVTGLFTKKSV